MPALGSRVVSLAEVPEALRSRPRAGKRHRGRLSRGDDCRAVAGADPEPEHRGHRRVGERGRRRPDRVRRGHEPLLQRRQPLDRVGHGVRRRHVQLRFTVHAGARHHRRDHARSRCSFADRQQRPLGGRQFGCTWLSVTLGDSVAVLLRQGDLQDLAIAELCAFRD